MRVQRKNVHCCLIVVTEISGSWKPTTVIGVTEDNVITCCSVFALFLILERTVLFHLVAHSIFGSNFDSDLTSTPTPTSRSRYPRHR